jgi:ACS family glucarate transporter-like MFS transporter
LLTGVVPGWLTTGAGALLSMLFLRFLLGVGEASTYPVAAKAIANWFPAIERSYANSIVVAGSSVGSALTPPAVAALMVTVGWRASFVLSAVLGFAGAALWWWSARDRPEAQRASMPASGIVDDRSLASTGASSSLWVLLRDRTILLLSFAYFLVGYVVYIFVFWLYLYLVDVRGFSVLGGGFFTSLPFVVAALLTAAGGAVCDRWSRRYGGRKAARLVGATGCFLAAIFLVLGAIANQAYMAVAALALCVGFAEATEGAFWSTASEAGGSLAGTACGILNTFGNLGGVVSTALVPILVREFGWVVALGSGSLFAVLAAATWVLIGAERAPEPGLETAGASLG